MEKTFDQALSGSREDSYLAIIEGANHFSLAWPLDDSTGRPFIDLPTTEPDENLRALLGELICRFIRATVRGDEPARQLLDDTLLHGHPLIRRGARR